MKEAYGFKPQCPLATNSLSFYICYEIYALQSVLNVYIYTF